MMTCRHRWLRNRRRYDEAELIGPCGLCDDCRGRTPRPGTPDRPPVKHMTCRYHWCLSKRREPDVEPCGRCQKCEAKGTRPGRELPEPADDGAISSEEFPIEDTPEPDELTKPEIIEALEDLGIEVDKRQRKDKLLEILSSARKAAQAV